MHVGIITYQRGHLKTWQILKKLLTKPFDITLYAFPFIEKPRRGQNLFQDRPDQLIDLDIKGFCEEHALGYIEVGGWQDKYSSYLDLSTKDKKPDVYLTCIAKIIPKSFISERVILNAHPALLPENRGLDAFKWAIVNGWPIGVSLHAIDENIDAGILLHRLKTPILSEDTLREVADRTYEMECDLLANFDSYFSNLKKNFKITDRYPLSTERIPKEVDARLEKVFQKQKEKLINLSLEKEDRVSWKISYEKESFRIS